MADNQIPDFLSLPPRDYPSDEDIPNPIQPALDTLFSEFSRSYRSLSPTTNSSNTRPAARPRSDVYVTRETGVDLRALDYPNEYDSHLMCPICHIPFIDPVVLDCDHTFCSACYDEYRHGATSSERSQCPSCRTYVLSNPKKASRLISNMCNDIKVRCPNNDCLTVLGRGYIERHVLKDCLEQPLSCPDARCDRQTKRKSYVPGQCIHDTHIECDCGAVIELGRGEWLKHKDEDCPNTQITCERCDERIPARDYFSVTKTHQCKADEGRSKCPGEEFGCPGQVQDDDSDHDQNLHVHAQSCPFARLAPHLTRQSRLLQSLTEQLAQSKLRNEVLESKLEQMNDLVINSIQPKLSHIQLSETDPDQDHDIEEIERDHIPSAASFHHHRDLLLPAHVRDLTPSPTFSQSHAVNHHAQYLQFQNSPAGRSHTSSASHQHLLALHESLRNSISTLESDMHNLHSTIGEIDARMSMQIMNETLRIKEELAHTSAALFSTRAQVQWLLRERMGMGAGGMPGVGMMRSRGPSLSQQPGVASTTQPNQNQNHDQPQTHTSDNTTTQQSAAVGSNQSGQSSEGDSGQAAAESSTSFASLFAAASGMGHRSTHSSSSTSPIFSAINADGTRRPSVRRPSGGSQERFKL